MRELFGQWAEVLDDAKELVEVRITREQRLAGYKFSHYATGCPDVDWGGVVGVAY
jgi:hypothetical protein